MITHLQRETTKLKKRIVELSAEVEQSIELSYEALADLDTAKARAVVANDTVIDELEVDIEEDCLKIMALYQPVAADLRMVVGVLKMNNDLERMGDLSVNIAEYVIEIAKLDPVTVPDRFRTIFTKALNQVRLSLNAMVNADSTLARQVCRQDDAIDELNVELIHGLRRQVIAEPENAPAYLFLISVSRSVERIADYATNIAEDVFYMVEGRIIRHHLEDENNRNDLPRRQAREG